MTEEKELIRKVEAKVGHPYHKNIFERIPREDVVMLIDEGFSLTQIGDYYNLSPSAIRRRLRHESL
jgi:hypothetical protein